MLTFVVGLAESTRHLRDAIAHVLAKDIGNPVDFYFFTFSHIKS
jgi:hypothetical protein